MERMLNTLVSLGLTRIEAEIYVFLTKNGPQKEADLVNTLNVNDQQLHHNLSNLQEKGFVNSTPKQDNIFFAVPFKKVLENLIEAKLEETERIKKEKTELLST